MDNGYDLFRSFYLLDYLFFLKNKDKIEEFTKYCSLIIKLSKDKFLNRMIKLNKWLAFSLLDRQLLYNSTHDDVFPNYSNISETIYNCIEELSIEDKNQIKNNWNELKDNNMNCKICFINNFLYKYK